MDDNTRIQQRKMLVERWESTGLLRGIKDGFAKEQMAVLLQNQALDNETNGNFRNECLDPDAQGRYVHFQQISIPIVRRVFNPNSLLAYKIASLQAIQMVEDNYLYRDSYGLLKSRNISARARSIRERVNLCFQNCDYTFEHGFDETAQLCADMSERFAGEMNEETVKDLSVNAGVKNIHDWKNIEVLKTAIGLVAGQMYRKTHKDANWLVVSARMASDLFGEKKESASPFGYAGKLNEKYHVYIFDKTNDDEVLLGHKGDEYTAGYFLCPMTPIFFMPGSVSLGEGKSYPYMTRYGKAMPFPDFYGHITVTGRQADNKEKQDV